MATLIKKNHQIIAKNLKSHQMYLQKHQIQNFASILPKEHKFYTTIGRTGAPFAPLSTQSLNSLPGLFPSTKNLMFGTLGQDTTRPTCDGQVK